MSSLATPVLLALVFAPLALLVLAAVTWCWLHHRHLQPACDAPQRVLAAVVRRATATRRDWAAAMAAELQHVQGAAARWRFALGCATAIAFPPRTDGGPRFLAPPGVRLASPCATLGVLLPPLSLPLLYVVSLGCEAWMTHDDFSSGELVPTLLGALVWCCVACMLAGIPLAIAGAVRRERPVRLLLLGPITSIAVFGYLQAVQWLAVTIARS